MISVVIPTRNPGPALEACLNSLWYQTYPDYEVCLIDGGSTDDTIERVRAHAKRTGRVLLWQSEPDCGVYEAMNKGISRARGEWLYFIGADDTLHDADVFSDVVRYAEIADADLMYGDVIEQSTGARYGGEFSLERLLFEGNICHQAIFFRRTLFDRMGRFSLRYPIWADWEFNIRCFRHPDVRTRWIDRTIAVYADRCGISRTEDPVFRRELPATLLRDAARLEQELTAIKATLWYRAWNRLRRRSLHLPGER